MLDVTPADRAAWTIAKTMTMTNTTRGVRRTRVVADLVLADGKIDPSERRLLQRLPVDFGLPARTAMNVDTLLVKNHL